MPFGMLGLCVFLFIATTQREIKSSLAKLNVFQRGSWVALDRATQEERQLIRQSFQGGACASLRSHSFRVLRFLWGQAKDGCRPSEVAGVAKQFDV